MTAAANNGGVRHRSPAALLRTLPIRLAKNAEWCVGGAGDIEPPIRLLSVDDACTRITLGD